MVQKLKYEEFVNKLDAFYTASRDKHSVYLTFKRVYDEKFKNKKNKKIRKQRYEDRKNQDKSQDRFKVLVRAKLKKSRIQTILNDDELNKFHHILMNVLTLYFIRDDNKAKAKPKKLPIKKMSKTKKRKMKRLRKIKNLPDKMQVDPQLKITEVKK